MEKPVIYVYLIGGFTDNIKIYNIKETEIGLLFNIVFVVKDNYKSPTRSNNHGLYDHYSLPDVILESDVPKNVKPARFQPKTLADIIPGQIYCYRNQYGKSDLFITKVLLVGDMFNILLNPTKKVSDYVNSVIATIKHDNWVLVGNRCSYLQTAYHGGDKIERLLLIGSTLESHPEIKNIVLALDDDSFLPAFRYIFGDILEGRTILKLRLPNNHEYEYIEIAKYCTPLTKFIQPARFAKFRNFIHDHSGFYSLLESYIGIGKN